MRYRSISKTIVYLRKLTACNTDTQSGCGGGHRLARHTFYGFSQWLGNLPFSRQPTARLHPTLPLPLCGSTLEHLPPGEDHSPFAFTSISAEGKYIYTHTRTKEQTNPPKQKNKNQTFFLSLEKPDGISHTCLWCLPSKSSDQFSLHFFFLAEKSSHGYFTR